jgi:hypothetical protein
MTAIYLVYPRKFSRLMRPRKASAWERVTAASMMLLLTRLIDRGIAGLTAAWLVVAAAAVLPLEALNLAEGRVVHGAGAYHSRRFVL